MNVQTKLMDATLAIEPHASILLDVTHVPVRLDTLVKGPWAPAKKLVMLMSPLLY